MNRPTQTILAAASTLLCLGCATTEPPAPPPLMPALREALTEPAAATVSMPARPASAAAPAASPDPLARVPSVQSERRFSLVLANATPEMLFMSVLADTPLSVAVDPAIKGPLSITLKDVTLREALELLRELHNLEYKVIGRHILVSPAAMAKFTPSTGRTSSPSVRAIATPSPSTCSSAAVAASGRSAGSGAFMRVGRPLQGRSRSRRRKAERGERGADEADGP